MIKLQCFTYQRIRLNELYKIMESFFQILNSFLNFWLKTENFQKNSYRGVKIDQIAMSYISMDLTLQALQTYVKLFFKFRNHFSN